MNIIWICGRYGNDCRNVYQSFGETADIKYKCKGSGGGSKYRPGGSNIKLIGSGSDRVGSGLVRAEILVGP